MFTRSMFGTEEIGTQRELLNRVSEMTDAGKLKSTVTERPGRPSVEVLCAEHPRQESDRVIGKQVLYGF